MNTLFSAHTDSRVSAVLKDKNLATNYGVQEVNLKWFDLKGT